jgi:molybdopterin biosynthesis enzyme
MAQSTATTAGTDAANHLLLQVLGAVGVDSKYPMIAVDAALDLVVRHTPADLGTTTVALADSLRYVAAADVACTEQVPRVDVSIVDGFAVCDDNPTNRNSNPSGDDLVVVGAVVAGQEGRGVVADKLVAGQAIYVTTGTALPRGTARVVPIEHCAAGTVTGTVRVASLQQEGNRWIRKAGSDVATGQVSSPSPRVCMVFRVVWPDFRC